MQPSAVTPLPPSPVEFSVLAEAETLPGVLRTLVDRYPDYECLTFVDREGERRVTVRALWRGAVAFCSRLLANGVGAGQTVVIVLPTGSEVVEAYFGTLLAGAVPALVAEPLHRVADPGVYRERLRTILELAGTAALVCRDEVARILCDAPSVLPEGAVRLGVEESGAAPLPPPIPTVEVRADDVATVQFSSGSTARPRGVLLTHRAILNNLRATRDVLELGAGDVAVNWIPLYHDMGLIDGFLLPLLSANATVLIPTHAFVRDPVLWLRTIDRYRGTQAWAPNFAYSLCAKRIPERLVEGLDLSSWRIAVTASEPVLAETLDAFCERFAGCGFSRAAITPFYGLAENVTAVTAHPVAEPPRVETLARDALASRDVARVVQGDGLACVAVGRCLPGCEIEIRDRDRSPLPERHVGNVWIRSDCTFEGYLGDPELTARTLVDGWLDTGDRGYVDAGDLFFVAREKDLIVIGGEKVVPHDVEGIVNEVEGVRAGCAVAFGAMNPARGTEDVVVVAETREADASGLESLRRDIARRVLTRLGLSPCHVVLVPPGGVEKTTSGKLARRANQERYAPALFGG